MSTEHRCRGCDAHDVIQVVDLGPQPGADHFPPVSTLDEGPRWPLELWLCRSCTLVQLGPVEPQLPEPPLAVESATSLAHADSSVRELVREYPELVGATVAEFDSHHGGSWLQHLRAAGCRPVADDVERAHLVVDVHGLAHEPAIGRSLAERADRLAPGGLLVLEFHHLLPLLADGQFDTIRHGHWSYLSLGAVSRLAAPLGLTVTAVRRVPLFGGSLQVMLRHAGGLETAAASVKAVFEDEAAAGVDDPDRLAGLHAVAHRSGAALHDYLVEQRAWGRTVLGYGAPSKAPVLLDVGRVGADLLPFTVDAAAGKHGRRIPGCGIPIRPVDDLRTARPDVVLILTWDIADEVIAALEAGGGWGAEYLLPIPAPHVINS